MIIVEHLSKSYHRKTVVQDLSFAVPEGNVLHFWAAMAPEKAQPSK